MGRDRVRKEGGGSREAPGGRSRPASQDRTQAGSGRAESRQKGHRPRQGRRSGGRQAGRDSAPGQTPTPQPHDLRAFVETEPALPRPEADAVLRGPDPDDRFAPLRAEHEQVVAWLDDLQRFAGGDDERVDRWNRLATALETHARAEEWEFYPHLKRVPGLAKMVKGALQGHARMRRIVRKIDAKQGDDPEYRALLADLARMLKHHVDLEERYVMPLAVQVLGKQPVDELVAAYIRQRRRLEPAVEDERVRPGKRGRRIGRSSTRVRHALD